MAKVRVATTIPPGSRPASSPTPSQSSLRSLSRANTMLRRNSSGFSLKAVTRSESKSSLRKETLVQASADEGHLLPSPVPESPVREAAAHADEVATLSPGHPAHNPSPLCHEAKPSPSPSPVAPTPIAPATQKREPIAEAPKPAPASAAPPAAPTPTPVATTSESQSCLSPPQAPVAQASSPPQASASRSTSSPQAPGPVATAKNKIGVIEPAGDVISPQASAKPSRASLDAQESVPVPAPAPPAPAHLDIATVVDDPYAAAVAHRFAWRDEETVASPHRSPPSIHPGPSREQSVASSEQSAPRKSRSPSREKLHASPHSITGTLSPTASESSLASSSSYGQVVNISSIGGQVATSKDPNFEHRGRTRSRSSILYVRVTFV